MTELIGKIAAALKGADPEALILSGEIRGGMERPCYQLMPGCTSLKKEMGRRYRKREAAEVYYYPAEGVLPEEKEEALQLLLMGIGRGISVGVEREVDRLKIGVAQEKVMFVGEEKELMMVMAEMAREK